ncbi:hypothetical protein AB205_0086240, partial [Aquarana catesbeiana]
INELSHVQIPIMLMPDDFKAYSKIKVDNHLFNKENMPSHFKFKEYCPMVFRNLRERFGIDDQDFQAKELPTYKDNDFINDGQKIYIDENNKKMFQEKLKKDVEFLAQLKLMDYSLLVGIHDVERAEQEDVESEDNEGEEEGESDGMHPVGTPPDSPGNTLNSSKPLPPGEFDPTIDVYGIKSHDSAEISTVNPEQYSKRFLDFINNILT